MRLRRRRCSRPAAPAACRGQLRHLPGRRLRQQGADLPRSGDRLPEPDPAAAAADAAGDAGPGSAGRTPRAGNRAARAGGGRAAGHADRGQRLRQPEAVAGGDEDQGPARAAGAADVASPPAARRTRPGLRVASAGDSVVPVRHVLGTVPVEADGSAHFTRAGQQGAVLPGPRRARPGRPVDAFGDVPAGRRTPGVPGLPRAEAPRRRSRCGRRRWPCGARRRDPSPTWTARIPFSYPRLVQPVLDRHCVECHAENADKAPQPGPRAAAAQLVRLLQQPGAATASTDYGDDLRTTPGQFGARASKLIAILEKGHYDVKLSDEDLHRLDALARLHARCSTACTRRKAARRSSAARSPGRRWSRPAGGHGC